MDLEKGLDVTGIDSSNKLLDIAKVKCPDMKRIVGDVRNVSLRQQYDGIIEWWCLFHLPKDDQLKMIDRLPHGCHPVAKVLEQFDFVKIAREQGWPDSEKFVSFTFPRAKIGILLKDLNCVM